MGITEHGFCELYGTISCRYQIALRCHGPIIGNVRNSAMEHVEALLCSRVFKCRTVGVQKTEEITSCTPRITIWGVIGISHETISIDIDYGIAHGIQRSNFF